MTIQGKPPVLENIGSERANRDEALPVLGLTDVLRVMRTRKLMIIATSVIVVAAVALLVSQITPLYRATAYVMIDPKQSNVTNTNAVIGDLSTDSSSIENQVQILRSRSLAGAVVDKLTVTRANELLNPPPSDGPTLGDRLDPANWLGPDWFGAQWFTAENWAWLSYDSLKASARALLG